MSMTDTPAAGIPAADVPLGGATRPAAIGRIEADMFCDGCLYNLHGLDVTRDERLNIAIVRCPECGKFHAAGIATGAGRVWLSRLARLLTGLWVCFLFLVVLGAGIAFFIINTVEIGTFVRHEWLGGMGHQIRLEPAHAYQFGSLGAYVFVRILVAGIGLLLGFLYGACFPVFLSHVRRERWFLLALILPLFASLSMYQIWIADYGTRLTEDSWWTVFVATGRQAFFLIGGALLGLTFGRRLARGVLYVVLSRKLLQYVRFLWEVDGKAPPALLPNADPHLSRP